jgi:hypothetical protein
MEMLCESEIGQLVRFPILSELLDHSGYVASGRSLFSVLQNMICLKQTGLGAKKWNA